MEILDMKCAQKGKAIADEVFENSNKDKAKTENLITKSLGVLQVDGVYAFFLYLTSLKKPYADSFRDKAYELLNQDSILGHIFGTETDALNAIRNSLSDKLDELLFAKELLERTLVYARYHAKALNNPKTEGIADKEEA